MAPMPKIAVLVEAEYQDLEVWYPLIRLREEGFEVVSVGTGAEAYKGKWGYPIKVDASIDGVRAEEFDGVVIPGGWAPDRLRQYPAVIEFIRSLDRAGKVVAAICHAGWVLCSADIVRGRRSTAYKAIRDDMVHAGARFEDAEVVVDGNLITSRTPDDLPAFCKAIIAAIKRPAAAPAAAAARKPARAGAR